VKLWKRIPKRFKRVAALATGAGLSFMGVGNIPGFNMSALESVLFGALGSLLGLAIALSFTYATKGDVPDKDFDNHINTAIESVNSKTANKDK
jgi:hypothetical protein